jgi:hypothetical protein
VATSSASITVKTVILIPAVKRLLVTAVHSELMIVQCTLGWISGLCSYYGIQVVFVNGHFAIHFTYYLVKIVAEKTDSWA